jgi:hydroxyacylglutathione hydrolase
MGLQVERYLTSVNAANTYICWCEGTREGIIVDPAEFTEEMQNDIVHLGISIVGVFITHGHYDHDSGLDAVREKHQVTIYAAGNYPESKQVGADDVIELGECGFIVAATPGHTEDSLTFISEKVAFVGDALFAGAVGGTSSRVYFEREVEGVRHQVLSLPHCTVLYPGHGPATTVGIERCYNPFFLGERQ